MYINTHYAGDYRGIRSMVSAMRAARSRMTSRRCTWDRRSAESASAMLSAASSATRTLTSPFFPEISSSDRFTMATCSRKSAESCPRMHRVWPPIVTSRESELMSNLSFFCLTDFAVFVKVLFSMGIRFFSLHFFPVHCTNGNGWALWPNRQRRSTQNREVLGSTPSRATNRKTRARVAEQVDAADLKSAGIFPVPVRFRSRAQADGTFLPHSGIFS